MRHRKPTTVFSHVFACAAARSPPWLTLCAVAGCHPTATPTANGMMSPDEVRVQLIHFFPITTRMRFRFTASTSRIRADSRGRWPTLPVREPEIRA